MSTSVLIRHVEVDASILLRALLNNNSQQSETAQTLLSGLNDSRRGYIGISTLLETFWVLRSRYEVPRKALCQRLRELLMTDYLNIESFDAVVRAIAQFEDGRVDFQDALLAERNMDSGCDLTHTLDRAAAARIPSMELLS